MLAILDERLGLLLLDKVGQLVSIGEGLPQVMFAVVFSCYVGWSPIVVFSGFFCVGQLVVLALFPGLEDLSWSSLRTFQQMCSAVLPGLKDLFYLPSVFALRSTRLSSS